jgi:hypothetical protein
MKLYKKKKSYNNKKKGKKHQTEETHFQWLQFPATEETHFRCGGYNFRRVSNQPRYFDLIFFWLM